MDALSRSPVAFMPLTSLETYNGKPYTQPPPPPQALRATVRHIPAPSGVIGWHKPLTVTLQWDAPENASGVTGYRIQRALNYNSVSHLAATSAGVTHYTDGRDRSLRLGSYVHRDDFVEYLVSAVTAAGESLPVSITVTQRTDAVEATVIPAEATALRVETYIKRNKLDRAEYRYRLRWEPTADLTVTGYEIQHRDSPSDDWTTVVDDTGNVTDYSYDLLQEMVLVRGHSNQSVLAPLMATFTCESSCDDRFRIRAINAEGGYCWANPEENCSPADEDFNTLLAAGNDTPRGIHAQGGTMYVLDSDDDKVYAYDLSSKNRNTTKDFDTSGSSEQGLWSDGETMWMANRYEDADESDAAELQAYKLASGNDYGTRDLDKNIALVNTWLPFGVWSDGETIWVSHQRQGLLYAYKLTPGTEFGDRDSANDFGLVLANSDPRGIWSDGTTMWVVDTTDDKAYAYDLATKARVEDKEFDLATDNANPTGIWSNGEVMWVADQIDDKIYAYRFPDGFLD